MSIVSYISMIRSASSAYEMRSEIVGALLSLNNNYSVFSVYTPQDNNAFPCAKEGSQNYWEIFQNGNDMEFPFAELLFGSKTVNRQGTYKASDDNLAAYSIFTFSISEYAVSISLNSQIYNFPTNIVTKIEATGLGKNYPIKSIIERTIDNLWDSNAPDPSQEYLYAGCDRIVSAYFPNCSSIAAYAFASCSALISVSFPACTSIGSNAFTSCIALRTASFPACTYIGNYAFRSCLTLISLYLLGSSLVQLYDAFVFVSTPIGGYSSMAGRYGNIYVPSSLYNLYLSHPHWGGYSNRIISI